jgi:hypothetical protein
MENLRKISPVLWKLRKKTKGFVIVFDFLKQSLKIWNQKNEN